MNDPLAPRQNDLANRDRDEVRLRKNYQRPSADLIHEAVDRAGTPFLKPFEYTTGSLTTRIAKIFGQFGFFGFEWLESHDKIKAKPNKFTQYGAAQFKGDYDPEVVEKIAQLVAEREQRQSAEQAPKKKKFWFFGD